MMKWFWLALAFVMPGGLIIYAIGWWLLRREGYTYPGVPTMYDGKEPYADWAAKMERARRLQEEEDRD